MLMVTVSRLIHCLPLLFLDVLYSVRRNVTKELVNNVPPLKFSRTFSSV